MKEILIIILILTIGYLILSTILKNIKDNYEKRGGQGGKEEETVDDPTVIKDNKK